MRPEIDRRKARERRRAHVRRKVDGTPERPRLNVFRSLTHIYAQIIDDTLGHTLVTASTVDGELRELIAGKAKVEQAKLVGRISSRPSTT